MKTYTDIKNAYNSYCESAWEIRNNAHRAAMLVYSKVVEVGRFPEGTIFPHPVDDDEINPRKKKYTVPGSVSFCREDQIWKLGIVIVVNYKEAIAPSELLRISVGIKQTPQGLDIAIPHTAIKVTIPIEESAPTFQLIEEFSTKFVEAVIEHYQAMRGHWLESDTGRVIQGFMQKRNQS